MRLLVVAALIGLTSCSYAARHSTPDEITLEYDTFIHSVADMQPKADEHCAATGRRAQLVGTGGRIGTRYGTFRCVSR